MMPPYLFSFLLLLLSLRAACYALTRFPSCRRRRIEESTLELNLPESKRPIDSRGGGGERGERHRRRVRVPTFCQRAHR